MLDAMHENPFLFQSHQWKITHRMSSFRRLTLTARDHCCVVRVTIYGQVNMSST